MFIIVPFAARSVPVPGYVLALRTCRKALLPPPSLCVLERLALVQRASPLHVRGPSTACTSLTFARCCLPICFLRIKYSYTRQNSSKPAPSAATIPGGAISFVRTPGPHALDKSAGVNLPVRVKMGAEI